MSFVTDFFINYMTWVTFGVIPTFFSLWLFGKTFELWWKLWRYGPVLVKPVIQEDNDDE